MRRRINLHLRRLLTAPRLRVSSRGKGGSDLAIDGLVCGVCASRTERALRSVPGVTSASVDLACGTARIEHGEAAPDLAQLAAAVDGVVVARPWRLRIEAWATRLRGLRRGGRGRDRAS